MAKKSLPIGQWVEFTHIVDFTYEGNQRVAVLTQIEPMKGVIVGRVYRQEGTYIKERKGGWGYQDYEDYEPPSLSISKVIRLWEVRTGWRNKPLNVLDEHLEVTKRDVFPEQAKRPVRIVEVAVDGQGSERRNEGYSADRFPQ